MATPAFLAQATNPAAPPPPPPAPAGMQGTLTTSPGSPLPASQPTTDAPFWARNGQFLPFILIAAMILLMMRSSKNKDKKRKSMLDTLKKGDRIQTIGGILGTVVELRENNTEVVVKVDENNNTKLRFSRNAIHRVVDDAEPAAR